MNREEKEMVIALGVAAVLAAVACILSFQVCVVSFATAITAGLWAYTWSKVFGEGLKEIRKRQNTEMK
jgi:uncharacterized protein (DUF697 family)